MFRVRTRTGISSPVRRGWASTAGSILWVSPASKGPYWSGSYCMNQPWLTTTD